jgi:hypothetical protein
MHINPLISNHAANHTGGQSKTAQQQTQEKANTTLAAENVDKFDKHSVNVNRNFNRAPDRSEFLNVQGYRGKSVIQMKNAVVADFVRHSLGQQPGNSFWSSILGDTFTPRPFAIDAFKAAEKSSEKHEDFWGVEAVAERIFTFAKTLAGDNDKLFDTMKNAFLKGFNQASSAAKGKLPDISHQTKARVLEMFDEWEKEIKSRNNPNPPAPAQDNKT